MGDIYLELTVANLYDPTYQKEVNFLVDTGSTRAWVPETIAQELKIEPKGSLPLELADGTITKLPYGFCLFDFGGEQITGNVVIGPPDCEPLLGTHILQEYRLIIDMEHDTISRAKAMKAK